MQLIIFLLLLPALILTTWAVHSAVKQYQYFRLAYKMLPFKNFSRDKDRVYSHRSCEEDDGFIWYLNDNTLPLAIVIIYLLLFQIQLFFTGIVSSKDGLRKTLTLIHFRNIEYHLPTTAA
jgi:hypothetical protein